MLIVSALSVLTTPLWGWISDRVGRRRLTIASAAGIGILIWPFFAFLDSGPLLLLPLVFALGMNVFHDSIYGPQAAWFAEQFPTGVRYSGVSLGYQVGSIFLGGPHAAARGAVPAVGRRIALDPLRLHRPVRGADDRGGARGEGPGAGGDLGAAGCRCLRVRFRLRLRLRRRRCARIRRGRASASGSARRRDRRGWPRGGADAPRPSSRPAAVRAPGQVAEGRPVPGWTAPVSWRHDRRADRPPRRARRRRRDRRGAHPHLAGDVRAPAPGVVPRRARRRDAGRGLAPDADLLVRSAAVGRPRRRPHRRLRPLGTGARRGSAPPVPALRDQHDRVRARIGRGPGLVRRGRRRLPAYLWAADDNPRAEAFYRRNGFVRDGGVERQVYQGAEMVTVRMVR
ncbi:MFS transporter [Clavibacter tessellarius]|uniref:MFS transporter n=1 Tax=Clavibacter tessellarius TaxID=31965 RepID=UPI00325650A2